MINQRYNEYTENDSSNSHNSTKQKKHKKNRKSLHCCNTLIILRYIVFISHFIMNLSFVIALHGRFFVWSHSLYILTHLLYYMITFSVLLLFMDTNGDYWVLSTSSFIVFIIGFYVVITDMTIERNVGFASISYGFYYLTIETKNLVKDNMKKK